MRYIWLHIKTILDTYDGATPLTHFLKTYFRQYPKLGSRDRKLLSNMAYSWYRCSKGIDEDDFETKIKKCLLICDHELPHGLLTGDSQIPHKEDITLDISKMMPTELTLSDGIDRSTWLTSMLVQPDLFIRVLKDMGKLTSLLNSQNISFKFITDTCLALPNGAGIDTLLQEDTYVVQDASSQETGSYFKPQQDEYWYDCCAGAGGKSLLLKSLERSVRITVSDKRERIIRNLQQRFKQYNYHAPVVHITDVADAPALEKSLGTKQFDNIICDAPCSGSGTWSRTPEQLYYFDPATLSSFTALQKQIATNVSIHLKPGGRLIYITCSVFKAENEDVISEILKETGLQLMESKLINGIIKKADSMYVAVLKKPVGK
jgi:16S rRNA (cytosine967-C5)-methyltransferase